MHGHAYAIEGSGFRPGDDVHMTLAGYELTWLRADAQGRVPGDGGPVLGYLPGTRGTVLTATGVSASGEDVYFEMAMCGVAEPERVLC